METAIVDYSGGVSAAKIKGTFLAEPIRIFLVEENRLLRDGLTAMIKMQPALSIVAAVDSIDHALVRAHQLKPHIILLGSDLQALEAFKKKVPEVSVVVMDLMPTQRDVLEFVKAGASGFILKDATVDDFLKTLRLVAQGEKVLPPSLTGSLFSQIVEHAGRMGRVEVGESVRLTKREREVMELIAQGLSNKEIAQRLHVAVYTVKSHVHNILEKLALRNRLEIANFAHAR